VVAPPMKASGDRDVILAVIARANLGAPKPPLPDPMEAFSASESTDRISLVREFAEQLRQVSGETHFVETEAALDGALAEFAESRGLKAGASVDDESSYAVLEAQALFADTGSAVVIVSDAAKRLTPYLPRTCVVVAHADQLHAHMTAQGLQRAFDAARSGARGEAVIITGPSRTADIEKTIVLGAHGPKTLAVFIVGAQQPE
jgi:L-lactate dehydrogenase complex protein LldG